GIPFSSSVSSDHLCGDCMKHKRRFSLARSAGTYEGTLLDAIHLLKYRGKTALAHPLASLLTDTIDGQEYDIITPVPLHRKRLQERGFNQSLLLARGVAKRYRIPIDYPNLRRVRATAPQINLSGNERKANVRGAFEVRKGAPFSKKRVLLIDDVYTTGATVSECSKALKKAGANEVGVLTLARVVNL
ncbi:MAG: ComF family protein, partial [Deltaproteobacteria bacterium]|nr:ComF family protein [Deltaproteobacteria bacterium]